MAKPTANKNTSLLLKLAEERALAKKMEEEKRMEQQNLVLDLPKDCISDILLRLPIMSLQRSRFVCKPWYRITNSSHFIDAHLRRCEMVLIFLSSIRKEILNYCPMVSRPEEKPNTFSVETNLHRSESISIFRPLFTNSVSNYYIQFLEIKDGQSKIGDFKISCAGDIIASCDGLILLENKLKKGGLIVMNPVTRKLMALPPGTIYPPHDESYGFALSCLASEYKVVHLFRDELGFVGCEILDLGTRAWRAVNGPSFGLFGWFGYKPVSAIGALHWVPRVDHNDYLVSMGLDSETFHTIPLPKSSRNHDGIVEMGGSLCFVTHEEINQIDIWILKGLCGENWTKQFSITVGCMVDMVPLFSSRINEELIFKRHKDGSLYSYDFQLQVMRKVEINAGCSPLSHSHLPHVNSLVSLRKEKCHYM